MFSSEKQYHLSMMYYLSNVYLFIHVFHNLEYYSENCGIILRWSLIIYLIDRMFSFPKEFIESVSLVFTSILFLNDIIIYSLNSTLYG